MAKKKREPGHPSMDIAFRVRNWGWYWLVKIIAAQQAGKNVSDLALDQKFTNRGGRCPAVFSRIRQTATSPDSVKGLGNGVKSICDCVHSTSGYLLAEKWFNSPLWKILTVKNMELEEIQKIIGSEISNRGYFRIKPEDVPVARAGLGSDEPALKRSPSSVYSAMLYHYIECEVNPEYLGILCALYREAHLEHQHQTAQHLETALRHAISVFTRKLMSDPVVKVDEKVVNLITLLIEDRVLHDRWHSIDDVKDLKAKTDLQKLQNFCNWYISKKRIGRQDSNSIYPIVNDTPRTQWLLQNKKKIKVIRDAEIKRANFQNISDEHFDCDPESSITDQIIALEEKLSVRSGAPVSQQNGYLSFNARFTYISEIPKPPGVRPRLSPFS